MLERAPQLGPPQHGTEALSAHPLPDAILLLLAWGVGGGGVPARLLPLAHAEPGRPPHRRRCGVAPRQTRVMRSVRMPWAIG